MRDVTTFGNQDNPIRASSLDLLVKCPVRALLMWLGEVSDESGGAAETGSMVHHGVEVFHNTQGSFDAKVTAGLEAMRAAQGRFPLADPDDARLFYQGYTRDPRNSNQEIVCVEKQVTLRLGSVFIKGTLDQIRRINGTLYVYDLKCGSKTGWEYLHTYAMQQSAYVIGANQLGLGPVSPGALIVANGWRKRGVKPESSPDGVFFWMPWTLTDCYELLSPVQRVVESIRNGDVEYGPGAHCNYCPLGGLQGCMQKMKKLCI